MNEDIKALMIEYLFKDETKAEIIRSLNDSVDIPFVSEKAEAKVIDAVWTIIEEALRNAITKG